jgi:hypothetical protein
MPLFGRLCAPRGSVQRAYVRLETVREQILCLRSGPSQHDYTYRAVLSVEGGHFMIDSVEAQEAQLEGFRRLLCSLDYPLQILLMTRPLDPGALMVVPQAAALPSPWRELAEAQATFVRERAGKRSLLQRHVYLIVPAEEAQASLPSSSFFLPGIKRRKQLPATTFAEAQHTLQVRVAAITRQCEHLGLVAHRLEDRDLMHLYARCLLPNEERDDPLPEAVLMGLDLPVRPASSSRRASAGASFGLRPHSRRRVAGLFPEIGASRGKAMQRRPKASAPLALPGEGDLVRLSDLLSPAGVSMQPDALSLDGIFVRTFALTALPRFVSPGFLRPLVEGHEPLTLSLFYHPRDSGTMLRRLLRQRTDYRSSLESAGRRGLLADPHLEIAEADVAHLVERLASGEERLLDVSLYLLLTAPSLEGLNRRSERLRSILSQMLVVARAATFEQDLGFKSCLPEGRDVLARSLLLDSQSAAIATFPFLSTSLLMPGGIVEGATPEGEPVVVDRWADELRNAHRLIVAPSGAGKSYKCKLDLLRLCVRFANPEFPGEETADLPFQALVIDPEGEYRALCMALGGQWLRLAPGSPHQLNPLDVPVSQEETGERMEVVQADALAETIHSLHSFLDLALADPRSAGSGVLTAQEHALLDHALYQTYAERGIIQGDPRTYRRRPPILADLLSVLSSGRCGPDPTGLSARLDRFVHGSLSGLFRGQTNVSFERSVVVFDVSALEGELRALGYLLLARHIWQVCRRTRRPRLLLIDELLSLYAYPEGARFLEMLFQRARKQGLSVVGVTQHMGLLRESTIPANCATKLLMAQEPESLPDLAALFGLSAPEVARLSQCRKGEALLLVGPHRLFLQIEASSLEHRLLTGDLAAMEVPDEAKDSAQKHPPQRRTTRSRRQKEVEV